MSHLLADAFGCRVVVERRTHQIHGRPVGHTLQHSILCEDPDLGWLSRVLILQKQKLVLCGIEKNAITTVNALAARISGTRFSWFQFSPFSLAMMAPHSKSRAQELPNASATLRWDDPTWRRAVILRDPVERFFSAWASKCGSMRDHDGKRNCEDTFGFASRENATVEAVASRLRAHGARNAHWAPQAAFCNGSIASHWRDFTHRIDFANLTAGLLDLVRGRVAHDVLRAAERELVAQRLPDGARFGAAHHAHAGASWLRRERSSGSAGRVMRLLAEYYAPDVALYARLRAERE